MKTFKRFLRGVVSIAITGTVAHYTQDPKYIAFTPLINAMGKYLRDEFGLQNVPF